MTQPLKTRYSSLQHERLGPLLKAVEKALVALEIDFYIVGALARDVWFSAHEIAARGTKDVDLAIYISDTEDFYKLKEYLKTHEPFRESTQNPFVMLTPEDFQVDLLPFGEIEVEGKVMVEGKGMAQIAVNGFREIYQSGTSTVEFEDGQHFQVCSLPGIVMLKLIAYDDRPEVRQKDIKDIALILNHYFEIETDLIYEHHNDLFGYDKDLPYIAARVIGRQMKVIIGASALLEKRVLNILQHETERTENSRLAQEIATVMKVTIAAALDLLEEIITGIKEWPLPESF